MCVIRCVPVTEGKMSSAFPLSDSFNWLRRQTAEWRGNHVKAHKFMHLKKESVAAWRNEGESEGENYSAELHWCKAPGKIDRVCALNPFQTWVILFWVSTGFKFGHYWVNFNFLDGTVKLYCMHRMHLIYSPNHIHHFHTADMFPKSHTVTSNTCCPACICQIHASWKLCYVKESWQDELSPTHLGLWGLVSPSVFMVVFVCYIDPEEVSEWKSVCIVVF